ncbi:MAG: hypothetical protein AAGB32_04480, partial [Pseudomonadota bacterium]
IILETTKSSIFFNPVLCSLYLSYTSDLLHFLLRAKNERISSQKVASTVVDAVFMGGDEDVYDEKTSTDVDRNVTHGQARRLKLSGAKHVAASFVKALPFLRASNPSFFKLKRTIYMGEEETCSCTRTAELYGRIVDGVTTKAFPETGHGPLMECAKVYAHLSRALRPEAKTI